MTEDQGWFYTNTFAVNDFKTFQSFCAKYGLEMFKKGSLVGCFHPELGLPQIAKACADELTFLQELASHLQDEYVAIVIDARITIHEPCSSSWQITYAINNIGFYREVNPSSIFLLARDLGGYIMPLHHMCPLDIQG
jgi:hypothetical protein